MHIFRHLFFNQFHKSQYIIPATLLGILVWLFKAFLEDITLNAIYELSGISEDDMLVFLIKNPWILLIIGIIIILIFMYINARREYSSKYVINNLTNMHKRLGEIAKMRFSGVKGNPSKKLENAAPVIMHKLGLVELNNWNSFKKKLKGKINRKVRKAIEQGENTYIVIMGEASDFQTSLVSSKEWGVDDLDIISECLDSFELGIVGLRDNDKKWNKLYQKTRPFALDGQLRGLISKHTKLSCGYFSISLIQNYAKKWRQSEISRMLYLVLIGSPMSPVKLNAALDEVSEGIKKRMDELKKEGVKIND